MRVANPHQLLIVDRRGFPGRIRVMVKAVGVIEQYVQIRCIRNVAYLVRRTMPLLADAYIRRDVGGGIHDA